MKQLFVKSAGHPRRGQKTAGNFQERYDLLFARVPQSMRRDLRLPPNSVRLLKIAKNIVMRYAEGAIEALRSRSRRIFDT